MHQSTFVGWAALVFAGVAYTYSDTLAALGREEMLMFFCLCAVIIEMK